MKITEITDNKDKILQLNVFPDVIKNRFDVLHSVVENRGGYTLYCIENNMQKTYIPVFFNNTSCELGCYMRKIDKCLFEKFVNYLFKTHKKLQVVSVLHTLTDIATLSRIMYDVKNYKRQNNTLQGTVRLWTSDGLGAGYVSVCLSDFYLQYPQISVDVVCSLERPKNLDKMDICIIYEEPGADMTTVFKGRLKFGLFASLDYLSVFGRPKSIEDLQKNHKICTRDNFASVWPRWKEILDGAQNVVASTNATAVLLSLIRDGNGVSLHPIGSASREKDLVFLSELGYEEEHDFWIATRKDYVQRPEVKVLIECIRDATLKI